MQSRVSLPPNITVGLDLGDRQSAVCEIDEGGRVVRRESIRTTRQWVRRYFEDRPRLRVVLEVGTQSPWVSHELEELGHEVIVANPSAVYGGRRRKRRNDRTDAEFLGRQGRADPSLLHPIQHRSEDAQVHLALVRARDQLVSCRTKLINHVRGSVKSVGGRISKCSAESFPRRALQDVPEQLAQTVRSLLETIDDLTVRIREYDHQVEQLAREVYPESEHLRQVVGVGALTATAYMLLIEDPRRFARSRDVGAYFGLVPRLDESGDSSPQLRITKAGDALGRRLLVSAAQYILGPFGPDCDLRRHGQRIAARGGKNARKKAAVAVARKLAVLLHRLWVTGAEYDPDRLLKRCAA